MGLPAELEVVVKDLWSLRLRLLQHRLQTASDENTVFSSQINSETGTEGPEHKDLENRRSRIKTVPSLIDSLGLCYLGMMMLRLPISLGDMHR